MKLTHDAVRLMRHLWRHRHLSGATRTYLARRFGVSVSTVRDVLAGRTWKGVGCE